MYSVTCLMFYFCIHPVNDKNNIFRYLSATNPTYVYTVQYTIASFTMKNVFKGTVSVILNDPLCKDSTARFTIVPLNIKGSVREK